MACMNFKYKLPGRLFFPNLEPQTYVVQKCRTTDFQAFLWTQCFNIRIFKAICRVREKRRNHVIFRVLRIIKFQFSFETTYKLSR